MAPARVRSRSVPPRAAGPSHRARVRGASWPVRTVPSVKARPARSGVPSSAQAGRRVARRRTVLEATATLRALARFAVPIHAGLRALLHHAATGARVDWCR